MKIPVKLGVWPKGWWADNVDPALNPEEITQLLERDAPNHPALPKVRAIVRGWRKARGRRNEFRCGRCEDAGWVFVSRVESVGGRISEMAVRRCPGLRGVCAANAERDRRVRERVAQAKANALSGEAASL